MYYYSPLPPPSLSIIVCVNLACSHCELRCLLRCANWQHCNCTKYEIILVCFSPFASASTLCYYPPPLPPSLLPSLLFLSSPLLTSHSHCKPSPKTAQEMKRGAATTRRCCDQQQQHNNNNKKRKSGAIERECQTRKTSSSAVSSAANVTRGCIDCAGQWLQVTTTTTAATTAARDDNDAEPQSTLLASLSSSSSSLLSLSFH